MKNFQNRELLFHKGVYSHECMDNWECFQKASLPPQVAFYSKLTDEEIIEVDY